MSEKSALMVIDAQVGVLQGKRPCYEVPQVLEKIAEMLGQARQHGVPVIYVQDDDAGPEGSEPWQIHPAIAPQQGELVVRKKACDPFYGTRLHEELQERAVSQLIVCGAKTEYCVDSACRRATTLGYNVVLVADAHTTSDTPALEARLTIAHANWLFDGFDNLENYVEVKPSAEIVAAFMSSRA